MDVIGKPGREEVHHVISGFGCVSLETALCNGAGQVVYTSGVPGGASVGWAAGLVRGLGP